GVTYRCCLTGVADQEPNQQGFKRSWKLEEGVSSFALPAWFLYHVLSKQESDTESNQSRREPPNHSCLQPCCSENAFRET
ncbi:hypothetical protein ATANTOWER_010179, partial [Ataeniobius toweri]|nr:hypothetical protein [Ataeniobius toweri]